MLAFLYPLGLRRFWTVLFFVLLTQSLVRAQVRPAWQTLAGMSAFGVGSNAAVPLAVATDGNGNVYMAGNLTGVASMAGLSVGSVGGSDVFVAKWLPATQSFAWVVRAGSVGNDYAVGIAVSGTSVYLTGAFGQKDNDSGPLPAQFGGVTLTNPNMAFLDVFVAKLTDTGTTGRFDWAVRAGGTGTDQAKAIAVSGASVYVAGSFASASAVFGATTLVNAGRTDAFLTKITDAGAAATFAWTQQIGGAEDELATAVAAVGPNVFLTGAFGSPTVQLGSTTLANALPRAGSNSADLFVAKLTDAGPSATYAWALRAGGVTAEGGTALAVNGPNVYVGGYYRDRLIVGSINLPNAGNDDAFVLKLADAGATAAFTWGLAIGGSNKDDVRALAVSGPNVYATGEYFSSPVAIGSVALPNASVPGRSDLYLAALRDTGPSGTVAWAQTAGGDFLDTPFGLAVQGTQVFVCGQSEAPSVFSPLALTGPVGGGNVGYLASLTDATALASRAGAPALVFDVYPNPVRGTATVLLPPGAGPTTCTVRNAVGQLIRVQHMAGPTGAVDAKSLRPGVYFLHVQTDAGTAVRRLTVE